MFFILILLHTVSKIGIRLAIHTDLFTLINNIIRKYNLLFISIAPSYRPCVIWLSYIKNDAYASLFYLLRLSCSRSSPFLRHTSSGPSNSSLTSR